MSAFDPERTFSFACEEVANSQNQTDSSSRKAPHHHCLATLGNGHTVVQVFTVARARTPPTRQAFSREMSASGTGRLSLEMSPM